MAADPSPRTGAHGALAGKTIAVTGSQGVSRFVAGELHALGARALVTPLIAILDPPDWGPCDRALDAIGDYDWIVFTSRTTWPRLAARLASRGRDAASCVEHAPPAAAIGGGTADDLREAGFRVALVPREARAEGLVASFSSESPAGKRILLPCALEGRDVLPDALRRAGAIVDVVAAYAVVPDAEGARSLVAAVAERRLDAITIGSGAAARALVAALGGAIAANASLADVCVAAIGPVTAGVLRSEGVPPTVEAKDASAEALVSILVRHFEARARARAGEEPAR
jgi:uroporphyrinogen III methyltransferase/synthase